MTEISDISVPVNASKVSGQKKMKAKSVATGSNKASSVPPEVTPRRSESYDDAVTALTESTYGSRSKKKERVSSGASSKRSVKPREKDGTVKSSDVSSHASSKRSKPKTKRPAVPASRSTVTSSSHSARYRENDIVIKPFDGENADEGEYAC